MCRFIVVFILCFTLFGLSDAQTDTPVPTETLTPTPTHTPTIAPYAYATIEALTTADAAIMTRFDYVITAGELHIGNLLTAQLISLWAFFLFGVLVLLVLKRK